MKVAFVASEVSPFAKTGGLADVLGSLPKAVFRAGHEACIILPYYRCVREEGFDCRETGIQLEVPVGKDVLLVNVLQAVLPDSEAVVYFLQYDPYYDRSELYTTFRGDYPDNAQRFILLSRGALELLAEIGPVDVIHCHDWQTGLIPVYLKYIYREEHPALSKVGTLYTVHNISFQGLFPPEVMEWTNLPEEVFTSDCLEFFGRVNFMKGGLTSADIINTVSKTYAREIQTPEFGCGLEEVLRARANDLYGVINGIDADVWNPETDPCLPVNYSAEDLSGKAECKRALQDEVGLIKSCLEPLIGMVCRLTEQKGWDILSAALPRLMQNNDVQFVVLGRGMPEYHRMLAALMEQYPGQVRALLTFDEALAHRIEAGSDMFLMPSRFEPCGLNQLFSLRYGTAPVVRKTGGLADTVTDVTPETLENGTATGFMFEEYTEEALLACIERAVETYQQPRLWAKIIRNGMRQDWSWDRAVREYVELYELAHARHA